MNRKARRAGLKSGQGVLNKRFGDPSSEAAAIVQWTAQARFFFQRGEADKAREICTQILAREPEHAEALNLSGLILQASGLHKAAVKSLRKAIASDPSNASGHYDLACSLQALNREDEAALHFKQSIVLGASSRSTEAIILRSVAVTAYIHDIEKKWPLPVNPDELFARHSLQSLAGDLFLRCALTTVLLHRASLEKLLTLIRAVLLRSAVSDDTSDHDAIVRLFCAIAQQCFINEYVFAHGEEETRQASQLRDVLLQRLQDGKAIPPMLLAAVGAYFPLHALPVAHMLLDREWPDFAAEVVQQQVREPIEEAADRKSIPSLTSIDDSVSLQVMQQYEENPYPRWTVNPLAARKPSALTPSEDQYDKDILIAGCGSGQHVFQVVRHFPQARVLAVDISLPSLAYARRKTREAGLRNIEYAQADILKLETIGRSFDRIESIGVLHHLAEPEAGWRALVSLLRPHGEMHIGLYSATGRSGIAGIRTSIATLGYQPTAEGIRKCRQDIFRDPNQDRWRQAIEASDFYSISGCRDLLFHVMEHGFTIPRIKAFLDEQRLAFLGFNAGPEMFEGFKARFPGDAALTDLDKWQAYEADHPQTFRRMYVFTVRKD
jgi:ubiquinone/menaquinone biosynthesis C-methylase UbiE/tetratricopeptide (TPR) repeat protein